MAGGSVHGWGCMAEEGDAWQRGVCMARGHAW